MLQTQFYSASQKSTSKTSKPLSYGVSKLQRADLTGTTSFQDVVKRVKEHADTYPAEWVEGRGWDQNDWELQEFPDKSMLDRDFPDTPVLLRRIDGHAAWANSKALQLAGLRGVDVRILIPDKPDHLLVYLAAFSFFDEASKS